MDKVYKLLDKLEIQYEKIEHPALYTAEDDKKYNITEYSVLLTIDVMYNNCRKRTNMECGS